jgi:hypothetical protein
MESTSERSVFEALNAELGAVLTARKAALEFERQLAGLDEKDRLGRELFELRSAEATLAGAQGPEGESLLAPLAQAAADDLEQVALGVFRSLGQRSASDRPALIRTVSALLRVARLSEARTRAFMTAARQGRRLDGFDEALDLAPETEQLLLALRRYQALLERGGAWDPRDADQLYLRALSAPGRLRLQAAGLRSAAVALGGASLPAALQEACEPFRTLGLSAPLSLAWVEAGFLAEQCVDWREVGLRRPDQAHAWHAHGFDPVEAAAWRKADMLPDEAGAFIFCGVGSLADAQALRKALGDVEHLLTWKRAGFDGPRVLELLAQGVRTPDQALAKGLQVPAAESSAAPVRLAEAPSTEPSTPPVDAPAAEEAFPPSAGGAWLAWGAAPSVGKGGTPALCVRALGPIEREIIKASEHIVTPGQSAAPSSLQSEADWEAQLGRGGAWLLAGLAPSFGVLTWGIRCDGPAAPWSGAVDFVEAELWFKRWARKTEEWGEPGAVSPCKVGRSEDGAWWIGFKQALYVAEPGAEPTIVEPAWPTAAWRDAFEDFCLKMEIPRQAPHWLLLTSKDAVK